MNKNYKIALITITAFILAGTVAAGVLLGFSFAENNKNDKDGEEKATYSQSVTAKPDSLLHEDVSIPDVTMSEDVSRPDEEATLPQDVPVATEPASAAPTAPAASAPYPMGYYEATPEEFEKLMILTHVPALDFRRSNANALDVAYSRVIGDGGTYHHYFSDSETVTGTPDPLNHMQFFDSYEYTRYNGENVDWIIRNVYGYEPDHNYIAEFTDYNGETIVSIYYHDGYYYSRMQVIGMETFPGDYIERTIDQNGIYTIRYEILEADEIIGYMNVRAAIKEVNGERIWTFYIIEEN